MKIIATCLAFIGAILLSVQALVSNNDAYITTPIPIFVAGGLGLIGAAIAYKFTTSSIPFLLLGSGLATWFQLAKSYNNLISIYFSILLLILSAALLLATLVPVDRENNETKLDPVQYVLRRAAEVVGLTWSFILIIFGIALIAYGYSENSRSGGWSMLATIILGVPLTVLGVMVLTGGLIISRHPNIAGVLLVLPGLFIIFAKFIFFASDIGWQLFWLCGIPLVLGGLLALGSLIGWKSKIPGHHFT